MLKKEIQFQDLDGNTITETFYFHISKAELAEMELGEEGGMKARMERIIATKDMREVIESIKNVIALSVGHRSDDGKRFIKSREIADEFMQTDAYSNLFMELITNETAAAEFVRGIMPADLVQKADESGLFTEAGLPKLETTAVVAREKLEDFKPEELMAMSPDEFRKLLDSHQGKNIPRHVLQVAMTRRDEVAT